MTKRFRKPRRFYFLKTFLNLKASRLKSNSFFCQSVSFLILLFGSGACQHGKGALIKETPLNISETRMAIVRVIGEPRHVSENGRELVSNYYDENGVSVVLKKNPDERYYSHVTILGDRRPYDILVEVKMEELDDGKYYFVSNDKKREKRLSQQIQDSLNQSREKRNMFDDFRPY